METERFPFLTDEFGPLFERRLLWRRQPPVEKVARLQPKSAVPVPLPNPPPVEAGSQTVPAAIRGLSSPVRRLIGNLWYLSKHRTAYGSIVSGPSRKATFRLKQISRRRARF